MKRDVIHLMELYGFTQAALAVRMNSLIVTPAMYVHWINFDRMMSGRSH